MEASAIIVDANNLVYWLNAIVIGICVVLFALGFQSGQRYG